MPVDASPYNRNPNQGPNLLQQIQELGGAANTLGQIEVGKGLQQAIQPDGTVDRNILAQHLKGSVAGSMQAQQALTANEGLRSAGYTADQGEVAAKQAQVRNVASALAPFMGSEYDKKGLDMSDIDLAMGKIYRGGGKVTDLMPIRQQLEKMDPMQRLRVVKQIGLQAQTPERNFDINADRQAPFQTNSFTGFTSAGSIRNPRGFAVPMDLAPGTPTKDVNETLPDGSPNPYYGAPSMVGPGGVTGRPSILPLDRSGEPLNSPTRGAQVVSREQPTDPRTGQPVAQSTFDSIPRRAQNQNLYTGLPPGEEGRLGASMDAYTKAELASKDYETRVTPLREAIPKLEQLGTTGTGPGTETIQNIQAFAQSMGIPLSPPTAAQVQNYAEAKKYLMQRASGGAPSGTNLAVANAVFDANPSMHQPNAAAVQLSKGLLAIDRFQEAAFRAFQKSGMPRNRFSDFLAKDFAQKYDPRGFMDDLMNDEQKAKLAKDIKPGSAAATKIRNSVKLARELGLTGDLARE